MLHFERHQSLLFEIYFTLIWWPFSCFRNICCHLDSNLWWSWQYISSLTQYTWQIITDICSVLYLNFFFGLYFINIYNSNMHWHIQSLVCFKKMLFYVFTICFVILSSLLPLLRALMKAWPLNHLVENQLTYRKYGTFFRFTLFSYLLNTCYSVTLFLHFHALYYITMQVWWSLNNFQTMMGEHATVQQTASRKMSLVIGARRHLEWGHEKYIMDTIQSHPAQVMVLL